MKKFAAGVLIAAISILTVNYIQKRNNKTEELFESSQLIQQQVKNVSKLVVSEGHFSHVYNYRSSKEILGSYLKANKRALVAVNADVSIAFDLEQITYEIDEANKTLSLTYVPKPELKIDPDLKYYDVTADVLNPFGAADYNKINRRVRAKLRHQIGQSNLVANAESRLIAELGKFYVLVNSLGWTLEYNQTKVSNLDEIKPKVILP